MSVVTIKAKGSSNGGTVTRIQAGKHEFFIDKPLGGGGTDKGAMPTQFLLAAWAGCLTLIGELVASEMNIKLTSLDFELEGDIDPDGYTNKNPKARKGFSEIRMNLKVTSSADRTVIEKWLHEVESRCPVVDNLLNSTPLKVNLV